MNTNIGIILDNLEMSQLNYETILTINQEIDKKTGYDYRIFFENMSARCLDVMCATMNITEMYSYNGLLISTTLNNTRMSLNTIGNIQRVFYVWDLEFLRHSKNFLENIQIYRHPNIFLVARSDDHAKALKNYCNRQCDLVLPKLSLERIKNELTRTK